MTDKYINKATRPSVLTTGWLVTIVMLLIVVFDQAVKFYVKTHFYLGEAYEVFPWFQIKFIENNGMAFGMELFNKFILTFGRIAAVVFFIWFIKKTLSLVNLRKGFFIACALITAGAAGNIFDCVFYGEIFNNPFPPEHAVLFPPGGGYAGWFEGRVVDMLYFPFFSFTWPSWIPGLGGKEYEFFQYIFNIADASICVGVALLIIFFSSDCSKAFNAVFDNKDKKNADK
ncbi:MAG: lipoprotein signal peptidase [Muribaculaceae bacterium]|nr:lipoprotein signal peptidase [Muribaculaceae bacterium]